MSKSTESTNDSSNAETGSSNILSAFKELDKTEKGIETDFNHLVDQPTTHQQRLLAALDCMYHNLRGLESKIDGKNYSRLLLCLPKSNASGGGNGTGTHSPEQHKGAYSWLPKFIHK